LVLIVVAVLTLAFLNGCFGNSADQDLVRRLLAGQGGTTVNWTPGGFGDYIVFVSDRSATPLDQYNKAGNAEISMISDRDGKSSSISRGPGIRQIYRMKKDGTEQVQLTDDIYGNSSPCFTSNGRILFRSVRDGNSEIYIMNFDGSSQTRITNNTSYDGYPIAYPNGSNILFQSDMDYETRNIFSMDYSGQNIVDISDQEDSWNSLGSISPAGNLIAFRSGRNGGHEEIFVMGADGSNQTGITPHEGDYDDGAPYFSPDGTKLVFYSDRTGHNEIYIMNIDGSQQTQLTNNGADSSYCRFIPDGRIIYASNVNGDYQIFVMNQDGSGVTALTTLEQYDSYPWW